MLPESTAESQTGQDTSIQFDSVCAQRSYVKLVGMHGRVSVKGLMLYTTSTKHCPRAASRARAYLAFCLRTCVYRCVCV